MIKLIHPMLFLGLLLVSFASIRADTQGWEYQVVILQSVTAASKIKKLDKGIAVDTERTRLLNELAASGWEVVSVIGAPLSDHTVYLRRKLDR